MSQQKYKVLATYTQYYHADVEGESAGDALNIAYDMDMAEFVSDGDGNWNVEDDLPKEIKSHWDSDPDFPVSDWQDQVQNDDTRQSYKDWVETQRGYAAVGHS